MGKINLEIILQSYSEDYFKAAKKIFADNLERICSVQSNVVTGTTLNILCRKEHLRHISVAEFAEILNALFQNELESPKFVTEYINHLNFEITDSKGNYFTDGRAKKYTDYISSHFVARAKDKKDNFDEDDDKIVEQLVDFVSIVMALYKTRLQLNSVDVFSSVDFTLRYRMANEFMESLFDKQSLIDEINADITGKVNKIAERDIIDSHRLCIFFVTWLNYLRICQDNGYVLEVTE